MQALIIDDEEDIRELLSITLERMEIKTFTAENLKVATQHLKNHQFQVCLTDMRLPDGDGLNLLKKLQQSHPELPVIVITAHGNTTIAVKAMKQGAFDFLSKPIELNVLRQVIKNALKSYQAPISHTPSSERLLGHSVAIKTIRTKITKISRSQVPVYIKGESGVGKELVARLIHEQSSRHDAEFIAVNCGAIPHELMESEFFGHKKGSFTGAHEDKIGLFKAAEGGTLFLDEVADLPLLLQVKLLRVLQEKKIKVIGEAKETSIDIRLLSATHQDLNQLVKQGQFRKDLYYRVNVIELEVPPLRQRSEDIPLLCEYFLNEIALNNKIDKAILSQHALTRLKNYTFPGNVRELANILEHAVALYEGDEINIDDLNLHIDPDSEHNRYHSVKGSLENFLMDIEKQAIHDALEENKGNPTETAKQLGMSLRSLRYRLKKLGLEL